ncbi:hypothetical protein [Streptomyces reniochalinae]|uniref:Uncharacterized protein n=1 Tax=Streptomyces reniochalinae TaxID=2250578 RepID=A0A367EX95_9ACTN|nr:hypothetical protein [Streptomyces reniochalinae]RCG21780.1 hypothetical protein DQ392_08715 [Streptomyces reniochalinae]
MSSEAQRSEVKEYLRDLLAESQGEDAAAEHLIALDREDIENAFAYIVRRMQSEESFAIDYSPTELYVHSVQVSPDFHERRSPVGLSHARRGASFAARLAGRRRLHLRDEWADLLAGADGRGLPRGRRLALVVGFLFAALRMRAHDLLGFAWSPMDWLLSAESRTNGLITASVGSLAIYIQAVDGFHSLVTDGWGSCAVLGGALFALARWLRRVRGIELAGRAGDDE